MTSSSLPDFERIDLFEAGQNGYVTYRIPVIACTQQNTLLALCEARKEWGDWADIDILLRRSTDGGKTWSPPRILADGGVLPAHNANLLIDSQGIIHFLFFINYEHAFHCTSTDDGQTFGSPQNITNVFTPFQKDYLWNVIAGGPGHGIVTRTGRLIVPVWLSNGGALHRPSVVSSITSDDNGRTWQRGEILPALLPNMNETAGVELEDGSILFNIRSEDRAHRRALCTSPDGSTQWTKPVLAPELKEPICMANLLRLNFADGSNPGRIVFTNPDNDYYSGKFGESWNENKDRVNLTIKLSRDDGKTWPVQRVIEPGISSYSDIAQDSTGAIYVLYERDGVNNSMWVSRYVSLAKLSLGWIEGR